MVGRYAPTADVDDIVQDVYIEFIEGASKGYWDLNRDVGPLLCQIAKRKTQLYWRRQEQQQRGVGKVAERLLDAVGRNKEKDEEAYEQACSEIAALLHCIEKLSPKSRAIVEQYYFGGITMKVVAEHQNTSAGTVKKFFHRVRLKLKDCIEHTLGRENEH